MTPAAGGRTLALLAEVLLVGVLVFLAALPVVTVLGATAAGCTLIREYVDGTTPTVRRYVRLFFAALRDPVCTVAPAVVLAVAVLDTLALLGGLPGAPVLGPVIGVALLGLAVLGLRGAAQWRPGRPWIMALRLGTTQATADRMGTALVAGAVVVTVLVATRVPTFALILPGLLALAAVATTPRHP